MRLGEIRRNRQDAKDAKESLDFRGMRLGLGEIRRNRRDAKDAKESLDFRGMRFEAWGLGVGHRLDGWIGWVEILLVYRKEAARMWHEPHSAKLA